VPAQQVPHFTRGNGNYFGRQRVEPAHQVRQVRRIPQYQKVQIAAYRG